MNLPLAFARKLGEPTLGELIDRHQALSENWTPETDGDEFPIADEIKVRIMADMGLSKTQADALGAIL